MLKKLIDPSALDTLTLQSDQRTLAVNLQNHWLLPFDNVSYISDDVSDTLCKAITGMGIQQRKLHTNSEDTIFTFQRCFIINGINNVATRADLLDRSILIELSRITDGERKELSAVMADFESDKAEILGGVFDVLVKAMAIYPSIKLPNMPRMADFSRWGYAIGEALGGLGNQFLDEFNNNILIQNEEAIACDPIATLIVEFMRGKHYWSGLCSELYKKLCDIAFAHGLSTTDKFFPKDSIRLAKRLKPIKSNLEAVNIEVGKIEPRKEDGQHYFIKRVVLSTVSTVITESPQNGGFSAVDNATNSVDTTLTTVQNGLTTANKAHDSAIPVDTVVTVDKNGVSAEQWYTLIEDVKESELPPEFLNPSLTTPQIQSQDVK